MHALVKFQAILRAELEPVETRTDEEDKSQILRDANHLAASAIVHGIEIGSETETCIGLVNSKATLLEDEQAGDVAGVAQVFRRQKAVWLPTSLLNPEFVRSVATLSRRGKDRYKGVVRHITPNGFQLHIDFSGEALQALESLGMDVPTVGIIFDMVIDGYKIMIVSDDVVFDKNALRTKHDVKVHEGLTFSAEVEAFRTSKIKKFEGRPEGTYALVIRRGACVREVKLRFDPSNQTWLDEETGSTVGFANFVTIDDDGPFYIEAEGVVL